MKYREKNLLIILHGNKLFYFSLALKEETEMPPPIRMATPYGGRLTWELPGGNKLIVHLKDKNKIRHRKRWSQVSLHYNSKKW